MRLFDRGDVLAMREEHRSGHHDHGRVDQPGAVHGGEHVDDLKLQMLQPLQSLTCWASFERFARAILHQRRMQINYVRHHRSP